MNKKADKGSPCLVPLDKEKYLVVLPLLIIQLSWFFIRTLTQEINSGPNPNFFNVANKKL